MYEQDAPLCATYIATLDQPPQAFLLGALLAGWLLLLLKLGLQYILVFPYPLELRQPALKNPNEL